MNSRGTSVLNWNCRRRLALTLAMVFALALACRVMEAQDVVEVRNAEGVISQRSGIVVDVNSDHVVLKVGDREQRIPYAQVAGIRTSLDGLAAEGDQLFAERQFELAFAAYGKQVAASTPTWMRRRLLAGRIRSAIEMESWTQAAEDFLILYKSDPRTNYFATIPLAWSSAQLDAGMARKVDAWLQSDDSVQRLLAASHGLSGAQRDACLAALRELSQDGDPRIAALAQAQLWRAAINVDRPTLSQWSAQIENIPEELRAGPHFVLGNAWIPVDSEQAVLQLMRVPVVYSDQFGLAARSLLLASEQLLKLHRGGEARMVMQELIDRHAGTAEADLAAKRIAASSEHP